MADTPVTPTPIGSWPTAPQRTDAPATFVTRADAWVAATPTRSTEMNALATNMNANAVSAFDSATEASTDAASALGSAATATAIANYVGAWADQTGAATVPTSVDHEGAFWILLEDVADITAWEPAESDKWARAYGEGQIYPRAANVIFSAADSGKIIDYTSGTFTQTFQAAATLGGNWSVYVRNTGTGTVTLDPSGSETIDGASTKVILKDATTLILCDGVGFSTIEMSQPVTENEITVTTGNGHGSTNTKIRRFTTTLSSSGSSITYADSGTDGGSFTINDDGMYEIYYADGGVGSGTYYKFGISKNSSELTTDIFAITAANRVSFTTTISDSVVNCAAVTRTVRLSAGDVIRAHNGTNLPNNTSAATTMLSIRKVGA